MGSVGILDVGVGNVSTLLSIFRSMEIQVNRITAPSEISACSRLILPGVGNFGAFMQAVRQNGFDDYIKGSALELKLPILGICVGAQALFESSEESPETAGLGIIAGTNVQISEKEARKIPRVGWDYIVPSKIGRDQRSLAQAPGSLEGRYFFSHGYRFSPKNHELVLSSSGTSIAIPAIIRQENILCVQFHPERSLNSGRNFLREFHIGVFDAT